MSFTRMTAGENITSKSGQLDVHIGPSALTEPFLSPSTLRKLHDSAPDPRYGAVKTSRNKIFDDDEDSPDEEEEDAMIDDDDEFDDGASTIRTRAPGTNDYYYNDYKNAYGDFPPPMPAYKQDAYGGGGGYAQSIHSTDDGAAYYAEQYNSHTNLAAAAAPISRQANNSTPGPTTYSQTAAYDANYNQDSYSTYGYDQQQQQQHNGYGQDVPGAYAVSGDVNEYGQYSNYGYGQGQGQTQGAYAYEPQYDYSSSSNNNNVQPGLQTHIMNVPPRTASRAQNHQYDQSYQHQGYGGNGGAGGGYDAYGRGGNGGYAVG